MEYFERIHIDSSPDVYLLMLDFDFGLIDRDCLSPVAVGTEQMFQTVIPVVDSIAACVNERFDASNDGPA